MLSPSKKKALANMSKASDGRAVVHVATGSSLVKDGLVDFIGGKSNGPATSLYQITDKGRETLAAG